MAGNGGVIQDGVDDNAPPRNQPRTCTSCGVAEVSAVGEAEAHKPCSRCGAAFYCSRECQTADWKTGGHKQSCVPKKSSPMREPASSNPEVAITCALCMEPISTADEVKSPSSCAHPFHDVCLKTQGKDGCPTCISKWPRGVEQLYGSARALLNRLEVRVLRGVTAWNALTPDEELDAAKAFALIREAAEKGHRDSIFNMATASEHGGEGLKQDYQEAVNWYRLGAEQGDVCMQYNCACLLNSTGLDGVRQDNAEAFKWFLNAAKAGLPAAQNNVGNLYTRGHGVDRNKDEAFMWFQRAAEPKGLSYKGSQDAQCNLGELYWAGDGAVKQSSEKALHWFTLAANQGHLNAVHRLKEMAALCSKNAEGAAPPSTYFSDQKSKKKAGAAPALNDCANCGAAEGSELGQKTHKPCSRCKVTFYCSRDCQVAHWKAGHKAVCVTPAERSVDKQTSTPVSAAAGLSDQQGECAICLEVMSAATSQSLACKHRFHSTCLAKLRDYGVLEACPLCRSNLPASAQRLYDDACSRYFQVVNRLTVKHATRGGASPTHCPWDLMTESDRREMADIEEMYLAAARDGIQMANWALSSGIYGKEEFKPDIKKELKFLKAGVEANIPQAVMHFGMMNLHGKGVKKNVVEGIRLLHSAANQDDADAQFNLGTYYFTGELLKQDTAAALKWFKKAAKLGHDKSISNLGMMYSQGKGVTQDFAEAARYYRRAAELGDAMAMSNLAGCYFNGRGLPQSTPNAVTWWTKAAALGHATAVTNLAVAKQFDQSTTASGVPLTPASVDMGPEGKRVQLKGIVARPELNGATGTIVRAVKTPEVGGTPAAEDEKKMRYIVELDGGGGQVNINGNNLVMAILLRPGQARR